MLPPESRFDEAPVAESEEKVQEPPLFKVLLHNDDYTTMDFVVFVLESIFNMPQDQAIQVMLNVHVKGVGIAGVFTYEVTATSEDGKTGTASISYTVTWPPSNLQLSLSVNGQPIGTGIPWGTAGRTGVAAVTDTAGLTPTISATLDGTPVASPAAISSA